MFSICSALKLKNKKPFDKTDLCQMASVLCWEAVGPVYLLDFFHQNNSGDKDYPPKNTHRRTTRQSPVQSLRKNKKEELLKFSSAFLSDITSNSFNLFKTNCACLHGCCAASRPGARAELSDYSLLQHFTTEKKACLFAILKSDLYTFVVFFLAQHNSLVVNFQ